MEYQKIIEQLQNKIYHPVYILHGEEPFYIDKISDYIEDHVLDEGEKDFNQTVLYGKDVNIAQLTSRLRQYPMGAPYYVIIVKEAQDIKVIEKMETYMENPVPTSILVLCYKHKKIDKRRKFYKLAGKKGVVFESNPVYDNKIPAWIMNYVKSSGYNINTKSAHLLSEYLGNNLGKIANEVDKMLINIPEKKEIDENDIEHNIGISKDYNIFELQDALGEKDAMKVYRIVNYFNANEKEYPAIKVIAMLFGYFNKLFVYHFLTDKSNQGVAARLGIPPVFVPKYKKAANNYPAKKLSAVMHELRTYDLKAKGLNNESVRSGELLREMLFRILH